jgi:hypothetical protein
MQLPNPVVGFVEFVVFVGVVGFVGFLKILPALRDRHMWGAASSR